MPSKKGKDAKATNADVAAIRTLLQGKGVAAARLNTLFSGATNKTRRELAGELIAYLRAAPKAK